MLPLFSRRGFFALALTASAFALACMDEPIATSAVDQSDSSSSFGTDQAAGGSEYRNPVYSGDFPDPYVLSTESGYYAYSTNSGPWNIPVLHSVDLIHWTRLGDALPGLPQWALSGRKLTWAPSVVAVQGGYLLFYTARDRSSGRQCIGRAESTSPAGRFEDLSLEPFVCQLGLGGSIDASVVRDSIGQLYLIWKNDGNCCGLSVSLWSQRLTSDGRMLLGEPAEILQTDQPWEGPLIEGPAMWQEQGTWHLLYSANRWNSGDYATGYAQCSSPLGPCRKTGTTPFMSSVGDTVGPGGAETFTDRSGRRWLAYHAWSGERIGYRNGGVRSLRLERLELVAGNLALGSSLSDR